MDLLKHPASQSSSSPGGAGAVGPIGSNRRYRRARLAIVLVLAFMVFGYVGARAAGIEPPPAIGFRLVMAILVACTLAWWSFADEALRTVIRSAVPRRVARCALAVLSVALLWPVMQMLIAAHAPSFVDWPVWWVSTFQLWHMGLFVLLPVVVVVGYGIALMMLAVRRLSRKPSADGSRPAAAKASPPSGPDRREFLKTAGIFTPVVLFGGLSAAGGRDVGRFLVNRYDLPAPWLPDRLRGLKLTHVSDLHVGRLYRPWMLPRLVDAVNELDGDLVLVTGDIIDMSNEMLPPTINAIKQFQHRHGRFLCLGNHDLIDDRGEFIDTIRSSGLDLLIDEHRVVEIGGERVTIGGLDWTGRAREQAATSYEKRIRQMLWDYKSDRHGPCIALAHHPHAFDVLADKGVPLTLSGHTHGGQLMLRPPRADGQGDPARDIGIGELLFRYMRGFYRRGNGTLFVNSGVGNWFPIRINAPAEIVQIRLV